MTLWSKVTHACLNWSVELSSQVKQVWKARDSSGNLSPAKYILREYEGLCRVSRDVLCDRDLGSRAGFWQGEEGSQKYRESLPIRFIACGQPWSRAPRLVVHVTRILHTHADTNNAKLCIVWTLFCIFQCIDDEATKITMSVQMASKFNHRKPSIICVPKARMLPMDVFALSFVLEQISF